MEDLFAVDMLKAPMIERKEEGELFLHHCCSSGQMGKLFSFQLILLMMIIVWFPQIPLKPHAQLSQWDRWFQTIDSIFAGRKERSQDPFFLRHFSAFCSLSFFCLATLLCPERESNSSREDDGIGLLKLFCGAKTTRPSSQLTNHFWWSPSH